MAGSIHLSVNLDNLPLWVNDISDALRVGVLRRFACSVGHSYISRRIAKQGKRKVEFLGKSGILFHGIKADTEYLNILFFVVGNTVAEPGPLCRSAGRVRLWIEPKHNSLTPVLGKAHLFSGMIPDREVRRIVTHI